MNIFICLDDNNGMLFNKRRQSQDSAVRKKMLELTNGSRLWMNEYSFRQFTEGGNISVSKSFLQDAGENEFCFVENVALPIESAKRIYVFRWNRRYPADTRFEIDLVQCGFKAIWIEEFKGTSHDKITLEAFERI